MLSELDPIDRLIKITSQTITQVPPRGYFWLIPGTERIARWRNKVALQELGKGLFELTEERVRHEARRSFNQWEKLRTENRAQEAETDGIESHYRCCATYFGTLDLLLIGQVIQRRFFYGQPVHGYFKYLKKTNDHLKLLTHLVDDPLTQPIGQHLDALESWGIPLL
ncbi:hypothetical protein M1563_03105 [Patescibacteria group bacterium]|nr:hypothetical protein [Patescibacteria group bacterium]MCL5409796.1 hypothetical protein [Patescibacteria group bacterium]